MDANTVSGTKPAPGAALPKRAEIADEFKWRLEDIYPSDQAWEADFQRVKGLLQELPSWEGRVGESAVNLLTVLKLRDQIGETVERIFVYARMRRDEDNTNPTYQALADRAQGLSAEAESKAAFIDPEILGIPDGTLNRYFDEEPPLRLYRFAIESISRMKPHVLTAPEEKLLAMAGEVGEVPRAVFSMLNDADLKLPSIKDEGGHEVELTKGRFITFLESKERHVRREAFQAMSSAYLNQKHTIAATLAGTVKRDIFHARARRYGSALEAALDEDNVPVSVYDNLIGAVRANLDKLHRYFALRKKVLGLDELHLYDLYTPLVAEAHMEIPYQEALEKVKTGLKPLGEEYLGTLSHALESGWVDIYENVGKTSGAYSWGAYGAHPFVLLNWQPNLRNAFTLAHEMGHAMHTYYSHTRQPYVYGHYRIFVAEVASTLNESLLLDHLLKTVGDQKTKAYLLNHYLEQFRGTVFRQTMFAEFEKEIHARAEAGEALTPDSLSEIYRDLNAAYHGPGTVIDPEIAIEWARVPHFYMNFYVYKYATGFSAATALFRAITSEGPAAVERYLTFLSGGGSDYPLNLLERAGVNMRTPEPVAAALKVFGERLSQLEAILS